MSGKPHPKQFSNLIIEAHWTDNPKPQLVLDHVRRREQALSEAQRQRAKLPRSGNHIKAAVIDAMRASRAEGRELADFIAAARDRTVEGIVEFTLDDDGKYSIVCHDIPEERLVAVSTLAHWWTEAGKPKKKKDR
jgi:hypothetical protein